MTIKIALDFHGVLADIHSTLIPVYNERYGEEHKAKYGKLLECKDVICWDMSVYALPTIYSLFAEERIHLDAAPMPHAQRVTAAWAEAGAELTVITDSIMLPAITQYLREHYPHINARANLWRIPSKDKAAVLSALGYDIFVEDYAPNLSGFIGSGYLLWAPYNAEEHPYREDRRAKDWLELETKVAHAYSMLTTFDKRDCIGYINASGTQTLPASV